MAKNIREKYIRLLKQIPDEILENLYSLDIITLKGKMQFNLWIADRCRQYRILSPDEGWLRFKLGDWVFLMETRD
jgi:hypothetical protein